MEGRDCEITELLSWNSPRKKQESHQKPLTMTVSALARIRNEHLPNARCPLGGIRLEREVLAAGRRPLAQTITDSSTVPSVNCVSSLNTPIV
jgi:hypothetical protein